MIEYSPAAKNFDRTCPQLVDPGLRVWIRASNAFSPDLPTEIWIIVDQADVSPVLRCACRSCQAGGPSANDQHIELFADSHP
jgi:hypothetical protein